mmetsp:Transcript_16303/g.28517  ORF Transcript_16303/g.28517 Transcript_16303/m.28517 type:complete len:702 (+) Transcript_16303:37-2142(+)
MEMPGSIAPKDSLDMSNERLAKHIDAAISRLQSHVQIQLQDQSHILNTILELMSSKPEKPQAASSYVAPPVAQAFIGNIQEVQEVDLTASTRFSQGADRTSFSQGLAQDVEVPRAAPRQYSSMLEREARDSTVDRSTVVKTVSTSSRSGSQRSSGMSGLLESVNGIFRNSSKSVQAVRSVESRERMSQIVVSAGARRKSRDSGEGILPVPAVLKQATLNENIEADGPIHPLPLANQDEEISGSATTAQMRPSAHFKGRESTVSKRASMVRPSISVIRERPDFETEEDSEDGDNDSKRGTRSMHLLNWIEKCMRSRAAELSAGILIILNAFFIGLQTDALARNPSLVEETEYTAVASFFAWSFFVELILRILAFKMRFFIGLNWAWNLFDVVVVILGVAEEILLILAMSGSFGNLEILRIMRVLKLARVIRIVRVFKVFRELRIMMLSVVSCVQSLGWTLMMLLVNIYIFSVFITTSVAGYLSDGTIVFDKDSSQELARHLFSSLPQGMLTMFQIITGGIDWHLVSEGISLISPFAFIMILSYVSFVVFAVMNIVTGLVVDQSLKAADSDLEHMMCEEQGQRKVVIEHLNDIFHGFDPNSDGMISWRKLQHHLKDPEVKQYFKFLQLDASDLRMFFDLLSLNEGIHDECSIDTEKFVKVCLRLKGHAKSADVAVLRLQMDALTRQLSNINEALGCEEDEGLY